MFPHELVHGILKSFPASQDTANDYEKDNEILREMFASCLSWKRQTWGGDIYSVSSSEEVSFE